jgi:hypothetical protein
VAARLADNAVHALVALAEPAALAARLRRERLRRAERLAARFELDLAAFLNGADTTELAAWCARLGLRAGTPGAMRQRLWAWGAAHERHVLGVDPGARVQPSVVLERGLLRVARAARGRTGQGVLPGARDARFPSSPSWPRPVPRVPVPPPEPPRREPGTLAELLARADAILGVRLGSRGRDKGAHGQRVAELLGLPRSSDAAPDWRGQVEVKTIAVARTRGGRWRLKDTPALSMRSVDATAKLARVLWVVRVDDAEIAGAPVLSWFYQELLADEGLTQHFGRATHVRPKGGAGTSGRGWYLRREFLELCGLMRSLNGE